jgi:sulfide:quinone oxidoreductase
MRAAVWDHREVPGPAGVDETRMGMPMSRTSVTVLGAGFAAITAIRELRRRLPNAQITAVTPRLDFHYLPGSIWIPAGLRSAADLTVPLEGFFATQRVNVRKATVEGIADGGRTVLTSTGPVANDGLVIASGGRFIRKLPGIEHAIVPCEGLAAGEAIRDRVAALDGGGVAIGFATNPAEPGAMRGGPMFEFLFGLDTLLRRQGRRERFTLTFFNPAAQPGARLGPRAVAGLLAEMQRRGIDTHLGHKPLRFEAGQVVTEGGTIPADLILFMPGMTGPAWLEATPLPRSPGGFVQADALCRVAGVDKVYVAGDAGSFPGPEWMPKQAHQADLHAVAAAENLAVELAGGVPARRFKSELVCVVDTLDKGMLVYRSERRNLVLPALRPLHWAKRAFERLYLRRLGR